MASTRKPSPTLPPAVVHDVLTAFERAGGAGPGHARKARTRGSAGAVLRHARPAPLGADEVLVMVVDRDMAVVRKVRRGKGKAAVSAPGTGASAAALDAAALRLAQLELVSEDLLEGGGLQAGDDGALTETEEAQLRAGGFELARNRSPEGDPVALARAEYADLLAGALDVPAAARRLEVNESRVRQRLLERSLVGVKQGRAWRLPRFQFEGKGTVRALEVVLPEVPRGVHPVALKRWLATPTPDLAVGPAETPASPLAWLASGGDPARVVALARDL